MRSSAVKANDQTPKLEPSPASTQDNRVFVWGLVGVALLAVALYGTTSHIGFLLDDFSLPASVYGGLHGHPEVLTRMMFFGGSVSADGLTCFRPGHWLSVLSDYALWGGNALGYHLTNILAYALNCVFVGLITRELAALFSVQRRTVAALAAATLFACYPLHVESTAWIIGRVDVFCTMFYLAATYLYLRHMKRQSFGTLAGSLACFLAALTCKEMAVTLPAVLSLLAFLAPEERLVAGNETALRDSETTSGGTALPHSMATGNEMSLANSGATASGTALPGRSWIHFSQARLRSVACFWLVLAGFAALRTAMLGTVVGGYGGGLDKHAFRHALRNFFDAATWWKIIFPATDEYHVPEFFRWTAIGGTIVTALCVLLTFAKSRRLIPLFAFLIGWLVIALLPTFQIFHIFPNLVGSRLFFVSSAPLCMMVALAFIAVVESGNYKDAGEALLHNASPLQARLPVSPPPALSQLALAAAICALVAIAAQWIAIQRVNLQPWLEAGRRMSRALETLRTAAGAATADGPPVLFADLPADYKGAGMIGRPEYLAQMLRPPLTSTDLSQRVQTCERPVPGPSAYVFPNQFLEKAYSSLGTYVWDEDNGRFVPWRHPHGSSAIAVDGGIPADGNGTHWITQSAVDPLKVQALEVAFDKPATAIGAVTLVWNARGRQWWQCVSPPAMVSGNEAVFVPARLRTWTFTDSVKPLGLQAGPGINVLSAHSIPLAQLQPIIARDKLRVRIDAHAINGCTAVRLYVAKPGQCFSDLATTASPDASIVAYTCEVPSTAGEVKVPPELFDGGSVRTACAQALNAKHEPVGILSEVLGLSSR